MDKVKHPSFAGMFYPADKKTLAKDIDAYFEFAGKKIDKKIAAKIDRIKIIISPHAGYKYSGKTAAFGYWLLKNKKQADKRFVLIGPSHSVYFKGVAVADYDAWKTPLGQIKTSDGVAEVMKRSPITVFADRSVFNKEHCLEAQLPFLQTAVENPAILPMLYSDVAPERLAEIMSEIDDKDTVFIISSDLSHYMPYEKAVQIDSFANEAIPKMDIALMSQKAEACGMTGILASMMFAQKNKLTGEVLNYMNSGDTAGKKDAVVGYGSYVFYLTG